MHFVSEVIARGPNIAQTKDSRNTEYVKTDDFICEVTHEDVSILLKCTIINRFIARKQAVE